MAQAARGRMRPSQRLTPPPGISCLNVFDPQWFQHVSFGFVFQEHEGRARRLAGSTRSSNLYVRVPRAFAAHFAEASQALRPHHISSVTRRSRRSKADP